MESIYNDMKRAKSVYSTEEELEKLLLSEEASVQEAVIRNRNFSENMQISLAIDEGTPLHIMNILFKSDYVVVRNCLAANKNCPIEMIKKFVDKKDALMGVASNIHTPVDLLTLLFDLDKGIYQEFLSANASTPIELLYILHTHVDSYIRMNIAGNIETPEKILCVLASDIDIYVRCKVADNSNSPRDILEKLREDNYPIGEIAKKNIMSKKTEKEKFDDLEKILAHFMYPLDEEFTFI